VRIKKGTIRKDKDKELSTKHNEIGNKRLSNTNPLETGIHGYD